MKPITIEDQIRMARFLATLARDTIGEPNQTGDTTAAKYLECAISDLERAEVWLISDRRARAEQNRLAP